MTESVEEAESKMRRIEGMMERIMLRLDNVEQRSSVRSISEESITHGNQESPIRVVPTTPRMSISDLNAYRQHQRYRGSFSVGQERVFEQQGIARNPPNKDAKLMLGTFDGSELYEGLGASFTQFGHMFVDAINLAQATCGYPWTEEAKVNKLREHLRGKALDIFQRHGPIWFRQTGLCDGVLNGMETVYKCPLSIREINELFMEKKKQKRSWMDHYLFLCHLQEITNSGTERILENIVQFAASDDITQIAIKTRYDESRIDHMQHAHELCLYAQSIESSNKNKRTIGNDARNSQNVVNNVDTRKDKRKCYNCNKKGHIAQNCRNPKGNAGNNRNQANDNGLNWALAIGDTLHDKTESWIVDTGCSRHMVCDVNWLHDITECNDEMILPDGDILQTTHKGNLQLSAIVNGNHGTIILSDVYYAPALQKNLISYGQLAKRKCYWSKRDCV